MRFARWTQKEPLRLYPFVLAARSAQRTCLGWLGLLEKLLRFSEPGNFLTSIFHFGPRRSSLSSLRNCLEASAFPFELPIQPGQSHASELPSPWQMIGPAVADIVVRHHGPSDCCRSVRLAPKTREHSSRAYPLRPGVQNMLWAFRRAITKITPVLTLSPCHLVTLSPYSRGSEGSSMHFRSTTNTVPFSATSEMTHSMTRPLAS